jgi:hypothetical protein
MIAMATGEENNWNKSQMLKTMNEKYADAMTVAKIWLVYGRRSLAMLIVATVGVGVDVDVELMLMLI